MARGRSKSVEAAIEAMRLVHGCGPSMRAHDEQKLANRARRAIERVVKQYASRGITYDEAARQIIAEARARGPRTPIPGLSI